RLDRLAAGELEAHQADCRDRAEQARQRRRRQPNQQADLEEGAYEGGTLEECLEPAQGQAAWRELEVGGRVERYYDDHDQRRQDQNVAQEDPELEQPRQRHEGSSRRTNRPVETRAAPSNSSVSRTSATAVADAPGQW